jgi:hypothetical protein
MGKFGRGILIVGLTLVAAGCAPAPKPVVVHKPVAPPPAPAIPPMPLPRAARL